MYDRHPVARTAPLDLASLPTTGPWEVGVLVTPDAVPDVDGMLLVVDAESGKLRYAEPLAAGTSLGPLLAAAASAPPAPRAPGRPSALKIRSSLLPLIAPVAGVLGAPLQVVETLPGVDAATAEILGAMHLPLPRAPESWEPLMPRLLASRPWELVPDAVRFSFPDEPALADSVAVVVGSAGGEQGVMLFPSPKDLDAFRSWNTHRTPGTARFDAWGLNLDPHEAFPPQAVRLLAGSGLANSSVALHVFGFDGCEARLLEEGEEVLFARAVEGVLGLVDEVGAALLDGPVRTAIPTVGGPLVVESCVSEPVQGETPDHDWGGALSLSLVPEDVDPPCVLVDAPHRSLTTTVHTGVETIEGLVLKMDPRHIPTIARRLAGVDGLRLEACGDIDALVAYRGDVEVGVVSFFDWGPKAWARLQRAGGGLLIFAVGGPGDTTFRADEVRFALEVAWLERR